MIDLAPEHQELIREVFARNLPGADIRVFGSRVRGTASPFSDLDLVVYGIERKDTDKLIEIKNALSESDLPILVDILDWADLSPDFRAVIDEHNEPL